MSAAPAGGTLDLSADVVALTQAICDVPSVSGNEGPLADAVEAALRRLPHLEVARDGDAVLARTTLGRAERVLLAGHLDTVPIAANLPTRLEGEGEEAVLVGRGTADMKGGVAVQLKVAAALAAPSRDLTFVFYDNEEVEADRNGLGRVARSLPDWLTGDLAVLLEPTAAGIEGGCNGTLRVEVTTRGVAAHSARAWRGRNAIHEAGRVLARLQAYQPREVEVEGLVFREGLNAVAISGGIAGNVIPDECRVLVNYRFAPDKDLATATGHVREVFAGYEVAVVDGADGARPGLDRPAAAAFAAAIGAVPSAKYGWTDVARFSALGIPALNFGPGDPSVAHADDEHVPVAQLRACEQALLTWLG
ncbi:MAG TPA: succinyl-diaminopimelate desuccinylase [Kineosporiaceae bacterium]|jgi:succinyl-diaminopimelate desuccinylase|nr:succinyl-diaminopimelate desuccinylase [Kineosporiaceae bacterium]